MSVTITLPDTEAIQLDPPEAARLLVAAYGESAIHQPIAGHRSDVDATWAEVDHLLALADDDVRCPGCGGRDFRAAYRVQTLCVVKLERDANGEILIGPPRACIASPPEPTEADFYELLCAHCGERLDWGDVDHRSLYVWSASVGSRAKPVNEAYERGWAEGWAACLARVEELGVEAVLETERLVYSRYGFPTPPTLCFESAPAGAAAPERPH